MLPMNTAFFHFFIPHVYGSLWCLKHWSVRQIKPAQLAFGRTLIYLLTYLLTNLLTYLLTYTHITRSKIGSPVGDIWGLINS